MKKCKSEKRYLSKLGGEIEETLRKKEVKVYII